MAFEDPQLTLSSPLWYTLPPSRDLRHQRNARRHTIEQLLYTQRLLQAFSRRLRTPQNFVDAFSLRHLPTLWQATQSHVVYHESDVDKFADAPHDTFLQLQKRLSWPLLEHDDSTHTIHSAAFKSNASIDPICSQIDPDKAQNGGGPHRLDSATQAVPPPSLEEFVPKDRLPNLLTVRFGPNRIGRMWNPIHDNKQWERFLATNTVTYKRVLFNSHPDKALSSEEIDSRRPASQDEDNSGDRSAFLSLRGSTFLGNGNHSQVYLAPIQLPAPFRAPTPSGAVSVACKLASEDEEDRAFLEIEARMYDDFPRSLQEEWYGRYTARPDDRPELVPPVVPKYYGYYKVAFDESQAVFDDDTDDEARQHIYTYVRSLSPILLMENCGKAISPFRMSTRDKNECLSLVSRMHAAGFLQGSLYPRNIMVQPGPLTFPPAARRLHTPSFRMIDFGRGERIDAEAPDSRIADFVQDALGEEARARRELYVAMPDGRFDLCCPSKYYRG